MGFVCGSRNHLSILCLLINARIPTPDSHKTSLSHTLKTRNLCGYTPNFPKPRITFFRQFSLSHFSTVRSKFVSTNKSNKLSERIGEKKKKKQKMNISVIINAQLSYTRIHLYKSQYIWPGNGHIVCRPRRVEV